MAATASAILTEREPVGGGLERVRIALAPEVAATHGRHGQYFEARRGDDARGYFAIASAPGESTWDALVREGGSMGDALRAMPLGSELTVSQALGPGWPVDEVRGRPLVVAVTGSAISAVLSTLGARLGTGDARHTYFLYGVRERTDLALASELEALRKAGVDVAICLSREHVYEPGFYRGYVHEVARARAWDLKDALIFAAGNDAMIAAMREAAPGLGVPKDAVRLNA